MQAGLSRAIPMAIIGFMVGALITILIRGMQGLDPIWAAGPGLVLAGFMMAGFFVWGMGAFNPKLSVHGEAEEVVHEELVKEAAQPRSLLFGSTWMIGTIVLIVVALLGAFAALPGGFGLTQTVTPGASTAMVGYTDVILPFGGPTITVSTLVIFVMFVLIAFISLAIAAWVFGFIFTYLARGLAEVKVAGAAAGGGTAALPAPASSEPERPQYSTQEQYRIFFTVLVTFVVLFIVLNLFLGILFPNLNLPIATWFFDAPTQVLLIALVAALVITRAVLGRDRFMFAMPFIVLFYILYLVFYYVAIGLILPNPSLPVLSIFLTNPQQLLMLSLVNALLITLLILRPMGVLHTVGRFARWLAYVLRHVPHFLQ